MAYDACLKAGGSHRFNFVGATVTKFKKDVVVEPSAGWREKGQY